MGLAEKNESTSFPKLNLPFLPFPAAAVRSPDHHPPPPLETLASVPFKWEEKPGKPRPCTDIIPIPGPRKPLEPPPCRLQLLTDPSNGSPTTVLDGPDTVGRPRFSSFRLYRESFDGSAGGDSPQNSADVLVGDGGGRKRRGFLGRGLKRNGSFSSLSQPVFPRLCASIYQRLKHAVPWKSAKRK